MRSKRIDIKVGYRCNNRCLFCVQGDEKKDYADKTGSNIKEILRACKSEAGEVVFTGGEATVRPDLTDIVAYAKGLGYKIIIQSNGRMFCYKNFCREMVEAGADIFAISLHGHNAQLHDQLTRQKGSFEQTITGIRQLLSFGRIVLTNTVINSLNYRFLPEIASLLVDSGVPKFKLSYPHILGNASVYKDSILVRKIEVVPFVKEALRIGFKNKVLAVTEAIPFCLLSGFEECIEDEMPETKVFDTVVFENFNLWRREDGRVKALKCRQCVKFDCCEGPWREYPFYFGWDEFIPIKAS